MKVREIAPGSSGAREFAEVVKHLYPSGSLRLQQKDEPAEEFLYKCFVAENDGVLIGRAAIYLNPHIEKDGLKTACLGNYEFVDDSALSRKFLEFLSVEVRNAGAGYLIGPMNGSTWENYRFSLDHNSPNFLLEPFHHLYYNRQFTDFGFEIIARYKSNKETEFVYDFPDLLRHEKQFVGEGLVVRSIDMENYESELKKLYPFAERSFAGNFLYSPLSWEKFRDKYMEAARIIQPGFVLLAEFENAIAGFVFAYTDFYNTSEKSVVIKTLARHPDEKWKGLGEILGNRIVRAAAELGYNSQIHAFMKDTNRSVSTSERFLADTFKTYALYGKEI